MPEYSEIQKRIQTLNYKDRLYIHILKSSARQYLFTEFPFYKTGSEPRTLHGKVKTLNFVQQMCQKD